MLFADQYAASTGLRKLAVRFVARTGGGDVLPGLCARAGRKRAGLRIEEESSRLRVISDASAVATLYALFRDRKVPYHSEARL